LIGTFDAPPEPPGRNGVPSGLQRIIRWFVPRPTSRFGLISIQLAAARKPTSGSELTRRQTKRDAYRKYAGLIPRLLTHDGTGRLIPFLRLTSSN
jgi:hypothetical protein